MSRENRRYDLVVGVAIILTCIIVISVVGYLTSGSKADLIQGQSEATEYRISGKIPGRVEELYVKEGSIVKKGDTLVYISSPELKAKLEQANAAKAAALAQLEKAIHGARKEQITAAFELWQQALVQRNILKISYQRLRSLYKQKVISEQRYDEIKAKYDASVAQSKAAKSQYDMALSGARKEDKLAAKALVARASAAVQEVESLMRDLYLLSPCDGVVSEIFPNEGELVGTGAPIMTVTDTKDQWFTFNIREDMFHSLKIGQLVEIEIPALDNKLVKARVNYIAVRASYATWKATKASDSYDARTFEVRAVPQKPVKDLIPGMSILLKKILK